MSIYIIILILQLRGKHVIQIREITNMKQNTMKKLAKLTSIGLICVTVLASTPFTYIEAAGTQNTATQNTPEVASQALQAYLGDSKGNIIQNATAEQLNLAFSSELYYGRSLLTEGGQHAWDYVVKELLAFNPTKNYDNLTTLSDGHGRFTINLKKAGITASESDIKKFNKYLNGSEPRMFHVRNWNQEYKKDSSGNVESVTFYIPGVYMKDNAYQNTLMGMEKYVSEVLSVLDMRMTDAQKVAALYKKYTSTMSYAWSGGKEIGNVVGALTNRIAICGGYSFGFQYILMRAGVQSIYMTGDTSEGYHAWNYVQVDDQWYFVDSTWGSNRWLLKGQSSLTSHKPRKTQHFEPIPTLFETDYNLNDTAFSVEKYNEKVANETIQTVISKVTDVLNKHANELSEIEHLYMFEPTSLVFKGNAVENAISADIKEAVKGTFKGSLAVDISNYGKYTDAAELLENELRIGYQASDDTPYYYYKQGQIEVYK